MAQHHLPSLAALDTRKVIEPTGKVLGIGRNKGQTVREALEDQTKRLEQLYLHSQGVVLTIAGKRAKAKRETKKYDDEDRKGLEESFMLACKRSEVLRLLLIDLQAFLNLPPNTDENLCNRDTRYLEEVDERRRIEEEQEAAYLAYLQKIQEEKDIPMGRVLQPPVVRGDVVAPPSPTPTPIYPAQPQPQPQYPQYPQYAPQYPPQAMYPPQYANPPPAYGSGY